MENTQIPKPLCIGLTGNSGGGKSLVAEIFREYGAVVIDADAIGRESYERHPALKEALVHEFGRDILNADGTINRRILGAMVFGDEKKLRKLNERVGAYLWPEVRRQMEEAKTQGAQLIVVDAALIFEAGIRDWFDRIVAVIADERLCIERIMKRDGLSELQVIQRLQAQLSADEKKRLAHDVIINNDDLHELRRQTEALIRHYLD